jgi:peptide deformylase
MTIRKILVEPDPSLRQISHDVEKVDVELRKLMDDMLETMYVAPGIGLAAIQIGVPKRVIVIDLSKGDEKKPFYFVNPRIIKKSENNSTYEEGCLSVPGQFAEVDRPDQCHISYLDYNGQKKELKAEGLLATCIQHEMDHLEGILFIDYLSKLKKNFIVKKLSKQKKVLERIVV